MNEYTPAQKKALELGKSICVTAGAGTGKTFLLTKRYLTLLGTGISPKDIVALTYTEKAAAEMQTKISRALKEQSEADAHLKDCFETFSQATISTFHGFCLSILKEFAYEAGLDPGFSVMDELDTTELVSETIRDVIENPPKSLFDSLVHLHVLLNPSTITNAIRTLIKTNQTTIEWFEKLKTRPEEVRKTWIDAYKNMLRVAGVKESHPFFSAIDTLSETEYLQILKEWFFTEPTNARLINRLMTADEAVLTKGNSDYYNLVLRMRSAETPEEIRFVCANTKKTKVTGIKKYKFEIPQDELDTAAMFQKVFQSLSFLPGKDSEFFTITRTLLLELFDVASVCSDRITQKKKHAGVLDFDDLLTKTDELLSDTHPDILKTISSRYRYVLVDEVQDNDPKLIGLVKKICGDPKENDRLFIVGDAKQSIYLFRNADVAGFMDFLSDFPDNPAALDTSFRSTPEIITLVNSLFSEIFKDGKNKWDPPYDPIEPHRQDQHGGVETILLPYMDKELRKKTEAEVLASWIYDAVEVRRLPIYENGKQRAAKFSDVAILLERRTNLAILRTALEKYQIPYVEEGGKDFYGRQETKDVWAVLSAVLYPEDDIPLYGALRSPYFAVSDAELCRAASSRQGTLFSRLQNFAAENPDSRTAAALSSLKRWKQAAKHLPPAECFEKIIAESEILSIYAGIPGGERMEGNLIKLQDIIRSRASSKPFSLYEFIDLLETSMGGSLNEGEGEPLDECGNRVRIITVHSSKGLEYPIVCVAFAGSQRQSRQPSFIIDESLGAGVTFHLPWMPGDKNVSFVHSAVKTVQDEKEAAEHKRLFYVACTRARDYLVLCGSQETKSTESGYSEKSFLHLYDSAKSALDEMPKVFESACCEPPKAESRERFVPEAEMIVIPDTEEEVVCISKEGEYAMKRGTLLHEIFAGINTEEHSSDAEYFKRLHADFMSCELMQNVVREWCELPVLCGGERRVIDRFVEYADGRFAVIDYKTGSISGAKESGRFAEYQKQVSEYVELMQKIVGRDVSGWLYFAEEKDEKIITVR